jgi:hypothetical protein
MYSGIGAITSVLAAIPREAVNESVSITWRGGAIGKLSDRASAAAGIAAINSIGNLAGFAGPFAMGYLKDMTGDFTIGLLALAALSAIGALAVLMLRIDPKMEKLNVGEPVLVHWSSYSNIRLPFSADALANVRIGGLPSYIKQDE